MIHTLPGLYDKMINNVHHLCYNWHSQ